MTSAPMLASRRARSSTSAPGRDDVPIAAAVDLPELDAHARDQLVERERLGQIVARAELEAPQLRRQVGAAPRG